MMNEKILDTELENVSGGGAVLGGNYYMVVSGDTLGAIAQRYGTTVKHLMQLNPRITNANVIYAGEVIRIR